MKIYTKTGDSGQTSLLSGNRVPKYHLRIEAYGTVDELNSYVGVLLCYDFDDAAKQLLGKVQHQLFNIGSLLASDLPDNPYKLPTITDQNIIELEQGMDSMDAQLPALRNFILPGGHIAVAQCHVCRCVCRRAERLIVHLAQETHVDDLIVKYLNRLSDYFFMLARYIAFEKQVPEITWKA